MEIPQIAYDLRKVIGELEDKNRAMPDRDLAIAITHAEDALMRLNRYIFSAVGQVKNNVPAGVDFRRVPALPAGVDGPE